MYKCLVTIFLFFSLESIAQIKLPDSLAPVATPELPPTEDKQTLGNRLKNLGIAKGFNKTKNNVAISVAVQQARLAEGQGNYLTAINHYQKVVDLYVDQGDQQSVTDYMHQMAILYQKAGRTQQALNQYQLVLERKEIMGDTTSLREISRELTHLNPNSPEQEISEPQEQTELATTEEQTTNRLKELAETSENSADYKKSLEYYKLYTELSSKQKEAEQAQQLALQEKTFQLQKQAQEMSLLESETEVQNLTLARQRERLQEEQAFKRYLLIGAGVLLLAALSTFALYRGKRKALGDLNQAYGELNTTKDKLVTAEAELKELLGQQVSRGVAQQLMDHEKANKAQNKFVCVMFLDIREFTPFAEKLLPEELIKYQNDVFGLMIEIIDRYHGVINQFLGDGFMATFGLQDDKSNVCDNALQAAIEITSEVNRQSDAGLIPSTRVGIGLHAGNVVAGNVGTAIRKQYSITGNTVITAARIEQLNKKYHSQILISKEVYQQLSNADNIAENFLHVQVKGRKRPVELLKIA